MRVLFVHAAMPGVPFNCSIAALSSWLRAEGHEPALLVVPVREGPEPVDLPAAEAAMAQSGAGAVAFSFMSCVAGPIAALTRAAARALPAALRIGGGAHPTTYPDETLAQMDLHAVCVGEGEAPLAAFLADPAAAHPGLRRPGDAGPLSRWWAPDPSALPDWDRGLFGDVSNAGNRYERAVGVALSRGFCPFACSFCGVEGYRIVNQHPRARAMRLRAVDAVLAEIERAREVVPCPDGFASWDEVLPLERKWVRAFFEGYRARVGLPFACHLRVEQVTDELVDALQAGGCDYAVLGVECGDEEYRKKVLNKPFSNAAAVEAFGRLHAAGVTTFGSFMIGLPHETPAMLAKTVRLARELDCDELSWKYYTPERHTPLFQLCERDGLLIERFIDHPFGADEPMVRPTRAAPRDFALASEALRQIATARAARPRRPPPPPRPRRPEADGVVLRGL